MRLRYSSVRDWMAGSFVLPIHAILIFIRIQEIISSPTPERQLRRTRPCRRRNTYGPPGEPRCEYAARSRRALGRASGERGPQLAVPAPILPREDLARSRER